jgi:hypothetical protein
VEERHRRLEQSTDKKSTEAVTYHVHDRFKLEGRKQLADGAFCQSIDQGSSTEAVRDKRELIEQESIDNKDWSS